MTLIAEDLLLLLTDDVSGKQNLTSFAAPALGGALLVELALAGVATVRHDGFWKGGDKVVAAPRPEGGDDQSVGDPILLQALEEVRVKDRKATTLVQLLGKGLADRLYERLVDQGLVRREEGKTLGMFKHTRFPAVDGSHEARLREQLTRALTNDERPDDRTASLIALLLGLDVLHKVVKEPGVSTKDLKRRAREIAEGDWAAQAVKDAVQQTTAALVASAAAGGAVAASM